MLHLKKACCPGGLTAAPARQARRVLELRAPGVGLVSGAGFPNGRSDARRRRESPAGKWLLHPTTSSVRCEPVGTPASMPGLTCASGASSCARAR